MLLYNTLSLYKTDEELLLATVISIEYFAQFGPEYSRIWKNQLAEIRHDYQTILDENGQLTDKLNYWYGLLLESGFRMKNVGSIYAFIRGEDVSHIYSIRETIPHEPNLFPVT